MITSIRYAIWLEDRKHWMCQGLPNDPTDFGFALLYRSKEQVKKNMSKPFYRNRPYTLVPVTINYQHPTM